MKLTRIIQLGCSSLALVVVARSAPCLTWGEHGEALWNRLWTRGTDAFIGQRLALYRDAGVPAPAPETYRLEIQPVWYHEHFGGRLGNVQIWDQSRSAWFDVPTQTWFYETIQRTDAGTRVDHAHFPIHPILVDQYCADTTPHRRYEFRRTIDLTYRVSNHVVAPNPAHGAASHPARALFQGTSLPADCRSDADAGRIAFDQRACTVPRGGSVIVAPRRTNMTVDQASAVYNVP